MTSAPDIGGRHLRLQRASALAVVIGGVASIAGGVWRPALFWPAYLVAVTFVLGVGLGCLMIALLHRLTGGRWGLAVVHEATAAVGTIPISLLLALPIVFGLDHLYPWLRTGETAEVLNAHQQAYFAPLAWGGRSAVYALAWCGIGLLVVRGYRSMCDNRSAAVWHARQRLSAVGLIVVWVTVTFAATDWLMSLEPAWASTIYGAMVAMGFVVSGWAFMIAMRPHLLIDEAVLVSRDPSGAAHSITHDLGNMLLAFLLVWVYLAFSQFLIIWLTDLPYEITWYTRRTSGVWGGIGTALLLLHFAAPFALLLSVDLKRSPERLGTLALGLLLMRVVDLAWTILPAFPPAHAAWMLLVPGAVAAVGGAALWTFLWQWRRLPALPVEWQDRSTLPAANVEHGASAVESR